MRKIDWLIGTGLILLLWGAIESAVSDKRMNADARELWMSKCGRGEDVCIVMWDSSPRLRRKYRELAGRTEDFE